MAQWIEAAKTGAVPPGKAKVVEVHGKRLALANVSGEYFAVEDLCTHDNGPLGEGELIDQMIECPRHGARFNVKTGEAITLPAVVPVKTYPVKVTDETIYVEL